MERTWQKLVAIAAVEGMLVWRSLSHFSGTLLYAAIPAFIALAFVIWSALTHTQG